MALPIIRRIKACGKLIGERFAVFPAIEDELQANLAAKRIRAAVAAVAREFALLPGVGTASIGISTYAQEEAVGDALRRADKALYEVKARGRGTVRRMKP